jgi:hypothetical protein
VGGEEEGGVGGKGGGGGGGEMTQALYAHMNKTIKKRMMSFLIHQDGISICLFRSSLVFLVCFQYRCLQHHR